jgi:hypothetical protein
MKNIDPHFIAKKVLDISKGFQIIKDNFPKENERILKHLAAASIHMALFMKDFYEISEGEKLMNRDVEEDFLSKCGCKDIPK